MTKTVNIPNAACPFCGEECMSADTFMEVRRACPNQECRAFKVAINYNGWATRSIPAAIQTLTHAASEGKLSDDDRAKIFWVHGRCYQCVHWVGDRQEAERISKQGPIALDIMRGWMPFGLCNELTHEVTSVTVNGDASVKLEIYGGAYCPLFVPLPADKEQP